MGEDGAEDEEGFPEEGGGVGLPEGGASLREGEVVALEDGWDGC